MRVEREARATSLDRCEAELRRSSDVTPVEWGRTVDESEGVLPGWHSRSRASIERDARDPERVAGRVVVFALRTRRCLALEAVTEGPADVVGRRLADVRGIARSVTLQDGAVSPSRAPPTP